MNFIKRNIFEKKAKVGQAVLYKSNTGVLHYKKIPQQLNVVAEQTFFAECKTLYFAEILK